jgi:hypothetical protein
LAGGDAVGEDAGDCVCEGRCYRLAPGLHLLISLSTRIGKIRSFPELLEVKRTKSHQNADLSS